MLSNNSLLPEIKGPEDIKTLNGQKLEMLAKEIREVIISRVAKNGGHLASNLGAVDLSIALHKVFNSPEDKIIWDVGHQCYAHKLITGRYNSFSGLRKAGGIAGFPKLEESPHDIFNTGHASTSISAAAGLLAAARVKGQNGKVIAVIGDGALTGGLAYEALSHAGHMELPLIVILNDNKMSISPNVGGLSKYLGRLSTKAKYQKLRQYFDSKVKKIPFIGRAIFKFVNRMKRAVKAVFFSDNFFVDLGFEYVGPIDGHNISDMIRVFEDVKKLNRPVVIHLLTQKGKGYSIAEIDPGTYHAITASSKIEPPAFSDAFGASLLGLAGRDKRIIAITAAMEKGTGLANFKKVYPGRFFDVGIAEEHAVTFAAGIATGGLRPVAVIYSTFIQRSVDQIIHDVALQKLPVIFALDRSGFVSGDGETHQGLFDIAIFRPVPNLTILAPASENELRLMLDYASSLNGPSMIRYPKAPCPAELPVFSLPLEKGRGVWLRQAIDSKICLVFTGSLYPQMIDTIELLDDSGIKADLYNLRFLNPLDDEYLLEIFNSYSLVVVIEEGIKKGGFAEYAVSMAHDRNCKAETMIFAVGEDFFTNGRALGTREELLRENKLDGSSIAGSVYEKIRTNSTHCRKSLYPV